MDTIESLDEKFAQWIESQCSRRGFTRHELSQYMGLTQSAVSKITRGVRQLKASELELARRYFQVDWASIFGAVTSVEPVRIVEAGVYRDEEAMERAVVARPEVLPQQYVGSRLFQIVGDGMDTLRPRPILDGDYLACSAPDEGDWVSQLEQGMLVVVERPATEHPGWERSLRQVDLRGAGELLFRSKNPSRKESAIDLGKEAEAIRLVGIVQHVISRP